MKPNAIVLNPKRQLDRTLSMLEIVRKLRSEILVEGVHFGTIPGTNKPTLLQPGAEVIMKALSLRPSVDVVEKIIQFDTQEPLFFYQYKAQIHDLVTGDIVAEANGSCNSREKKYRWRNVSEYELKALGIAREDAYEFESVASEPSYYLLKPEKWRITASKPVAYWQNLHDAYQAGETTNERKQGQYGPYEQISLRTKLYRVPNPEVWDLLNTIDKMAQKRAMMSAVKMAAAISEYFTVDLDTLADYEDYFRDPSIYVLNPNADEPEDTLPTREEIEDAEVVEDAQPVRKVYTPQQRRTPLGRPQPQTNGTSALQSEPEAEKEQPRFGSFWEDVNAVTTWVKSLEKDCAYPDEELKDFSERILGYINRALKTDANRFRDYAGKVTAKEASQIVIDACADEDDEPEANGNVTTLLDLFKYTQKTLGHENDVKTLLFFGDPDEGLAEEDDYADIVAAWLDEKFPDDDDKLRAGKQHIDGLVAEKAAPGK